MLWLQQFGDPALWAERTGNDARLLRSLVLAHIALMLVVAVLLAVVSVAAREVVAYTLLAIVPLMLVASIGVTTIGIPRFWLLLPLSPLSLAVALIAGLGPVSLGAALFGWAVAVPMLLGVTVSCGGALRVWVKTQAMERERQRGRTLGPPATLPQLGWQTQARRLRLVVAVICIALAPITMLLAPVNQRMLALGFGGALLAATAGLLRLEATLCCWLFRRPLARADRSGTWHASYTGRWSLFAPAALVQQLIISDRWRPALGLPTLALLAEGSLGPAIRRLVAALPAEPVHWLCLSLSLYPGGAAALRYLQQDAPELLDTTATAYAILAEEAARPQDLQRWLTRLSEIGARESVEVEQVLALARDALLCYRYAPVLDRAVAGLQQLVDTCQPGGAPDVAKMLPPWPMMLLRQVIAHKEMLARFQGGIDESEQP